MMVKNALAAGDGSEPFELKRSPDFCRLGLDYCNKKQQLMQKSDVTAAQL